MVRRENRYNDINTELLHAIHGHDAATGALSIPVHHASTFRQENHLAEGEYDYSRSLNPTRRILEETMAELEGGAQGLAFASGMAAIGTTLLLFSPGDHLVVTRDCYGGTFRILERLMKRLRVDFTFCDTDDTDSVRRAMRPNTRAIYVESPSNPLMRITDISAMAGIAHSVGALCIVDNTFMSPALQRPLHLGADIVLHSATKFIGGHSDVVAGVAVVREAGLGKELKYLQNAFGAVLGPQDSWLLLRGLKTLGIRLERQQATAMKLASWLKEQPGVVGVYYPGLPDHPGREIQERQAKGYGSLLSFRVASTGLAERIMDSLGICALAVSLGAVETIVTYPRTMSHATIPPEVRDARGVTDTLIRISVGLEGFEDLRDDLARGLGG